MSTTIGRPLSTGVRELDRKLDGGIPAGRIVAFTAPPDTQSELLVRRLLAERDTYYLSTFRSESEIREQFEPVVRADRSLAIDQVDSQRLLMNPREYLSRLPEGGNLIVDAANELESFDRDAYGTFLEAVANRVRTAGGICLLFCSEEPTTPDGRGLTLRRADLTWRLSLEVDSVDVVTTLTVTKFRGGRPIGEPIKLELTDDVAIDTSRDI